MARLKKLYIAKGFLYNTEVVAIVRATNLFEARKTILAQFLMNPDFDRVFQMYELTNVGDVMIMELINYKEF